MQLVTFPSTVAFSIPSLCVRCASSLRTLERHSAFITYNYCISTPFITVIYTIDCVSFKIPGTTDQHASFRSDPSCPGRACTGCSTTSTSHKFYRECCCCYRVQKCCLLRQLGKLPAVFLGSLTNLECLGYLWTELPTPAATGISAYPCTLCLRKRPLGYWRGLPL